jgi:hypothetical protein
MITGECVAVIDIGSARTKMTLACQVNGVVNLERFKVETGIVAALDEEGRIGEAAVEAIRLSLQDLRNTVLKRGCGSIVTVGTEVFRRAKNVDDIMLRLVDIIGPISILSPLQEGLIFRHSMERMLGLREPFCLLDVGGGSVQITWGGSQEQIRSIPTGTYLLEREFQASGVPSVGEYEAMRRFVNDNVDSALPVNLYFDRVVLGSNCMEEFLGSALNAVGLKLYSYGQAKASTPNDLEYLFSRIACQPYGQLADYYPANPGFMYGADKALINVLAICRAVRAKWVLPTNESISTGIARLLLLPSESSALRAYGLEIASMQRGQI